MGTVVFTSPRTLRVLGLQKLLFPFIFRGNVPLPSKNFHYHPNNLGSSRFCKCPRIGNVLKPKGPKGPRALKFYQSAGFCKIYYSHFIFEVMTFLRKIQNWYFYTKNCQIVAKFHKLKGKTTTSKFNLEGKTTTPKFNILNLEGKTTTSKFKIQIA